MLSTDDCEFEGNCVQEHLNADDTIPKVPYCSVDQLPVAMTTEFQPSTVVPDIRVTGIDGPIEDDGEPSRDMLQRTRVPGSLLLGGDEVSTVDALIIQTTHYENTPIQKYRKFQLQKLKIFR